MRARLLLLAGILAPIASLAAAPRLRPTRDVTVVYAMTAATGTQNQTVRWQAATGRQRVDAADGKAFMIADLKAKQMIVVNTIAHEVRQNPMQPSPLTGGKADFKKLESATFAGQSCTYWSVTPAPGTAGQPDDICLTKDGVMLALRIGKVAMAQAVSVTYAPADPTLFVVPAGYRQDGG